MKQMHNKNLKKCLSYKGGTSSMNNHAKALHAEKFKQVKEAHAKKLAAKSNNTLRASSWRGEHSNAGVPIKEQKAAAR